MLGADNLAVSLKIHDNLAPGLSPYGVLIGPILNCGPRKESLYIIDVKDRDNALERLKIDLQSLDLYPFSRAAWVCESELSFRQVWPQEELSDPFLALFNDFPNILTLVFRIPPQPPVPPT